MVKKIEMLYKFDCDGKDETFRVCLLEWNIENRVEKVQKDIHK